MCIKCVMNGGTHKMFCETQYPAGSCRDLLRGSEKRTHWLRKTLLRP